MIDYPVPSDLNQQEFHNLVTQVYYRLIRNGLDPGSHVEIDDFDDVLLDGTLHRRFEISITPAASDVLSKDAAA